MFFTNKNIVRQAIESTYGDTCDIYASKNVNDTITKEVRYKKHANVKCALSQKSVKPTQQTNTTNNIKVEHKLFVAPEVDIPAGCEVVVNAQGRTLWFKYTGESFVYVTHQELVVQMIDKS
jgi:hypothetical protein